MSSSEICSLLTVGFLGAVVLFQHYQIQYLYRIVQAIVLKTGLQSDEVEELMERVKS